MNYMNKILTPDQIKGLRKIDSPTIANAVEKLDSRPATEGYASMELRCVYPDLSPMVGYAVTCTAACTLGDGVPYSNLHSLLKAIDAMPGPAVVVIKDVSSDRLRSCHAGDLLAAACQRLGATGLVTDGGVRDINPVRERVAGFQIFSPGMVTGHGVPRFVEIGVKVSICGLMIQPGDLLHGDLNGLVSIPHEIAGEVADQSEKIQQYEVDRIAYVKRPEFTLDDYIDKYLK
jgi:4-hydroxy-4-methyl-2-oxoglutarate aldolase